VQASEPTVSIIVPAHNEEALLGATLTALADAVAALGEPSEIVVVDDSSTDRTAAIARGHGARVVGVSVHHIAAARNAGARAAKSEFLVFVDADTIVPARVLCAAVETMRRGAVGGGSSAVFETTAPLWARRGIGFAAFIMRLAQWAPGCFFFAERAAFERVGGFDERYFASEEIHLSRAMKRVGRFVVLPDSVMTSARKADHYSMSHSLWLLLKLLWPGSLRTREGLEFWYTRHHKPDKT
jgi:cellulose synthase/poly-beta-1,6-N-acetylglucosamine synthase-like glycosyltransferase